MFVFRASRMFPVLLTWYPRPLPAKCCPQPGPAFIYTQRVQFMGGMVSTPYMAPVADIINQPLMPHLAPMADITNQSIILPKPNFAY